MKYVLRIAGLIAMVVVSQSNAEAACIGPILSLNSSTVSRQHARLAYSGGKWVVANLSQTNPVVVNDQQLTDLDGERQLADGDRIELGEVVLRFHAH